VRGRALQFRDFSGGLNTKAGPYGLAENEAATLRNFRPTMRGSLKSRVGDTNLLDSSDVGAQAMMSLSSVEALGAGEADYLLAGMADGKLYRYQSGSTASLLGTFTASGVWDFVDAPTSGGQGPVYGVNGTIAKQITTAPVIADWTAATGTLPATAKYLAYVGNRVWAAGMSSYGALTDPTSALVFSNLGDPRDWPAANVVQFDPNDGEGITGIGEVSSGLLVFKRSKAWLVYDLDTGANRPLGTGVGCISHRSIVQTPYGTLWWGEGQVWTTDGSAVRELSEKIGPTLGTYLLAGYLAQATATYFENRYTLSAQTADGLTAMTLLEYDFASKSWWEHSTRGGLLARSQIGGSQSGLYAGGSSKLDQMFATPSAWLDGGGAALARYWIGPYHTLGPGRDRLRGMEIEGFGLFGLVAIPDFNAAFTSLSARQIRNEENLTASPGVRRENDFTVFTGVQVAFFAQGFDYSVPAVPTAIPGYVPTDVQVDAYTLYIVRRPG
jgi:hypothetical protein